MTRAYDPAAQGLPDDCTEALALAAHGLGNAAIGRDIGITGEAVHSRLTRAYRLLGLTGCPRVRRADAVTRLFRAGRLVWYDGRVEWEPAGRCRR